MVNFYMVHKIPSCSIKEYDYTIEENYNDRHTPQSHAESTSVNKEGNNVFTECCQPSLVIYKDTYVSNCWCDRVRALLKS